MANLLDRNGNVLMENIPLKSARLMAFGCKRWAGRIVVLNEKEWEAENVQACNSSENIEQVPCFSYHADKVG